MEHFHLSPHIYSKKSNLSHFFLRDFSRLILYVKVGYFSRLVKYSSFPIILYISQEDR
jgi:hypothetical protein